MARNGVVDIRFLNVIDRPEKLKLPSCAVDAAYKDSLCGSRSKKQRTFFIMICLCGMPRMVRIYKKRGSYTSYLYKYWLRPIHYILYAHRKNNYTSNKRRPYRLPTSSIGQKKTANLYAQKWFYKNKKNNKYVSKRIIIINNNNNNNNNT